ncbi:MAG TPA: UvrB/UvrC motif-containing protein [Candidatus Moranbacteria bacterium]|nr:UvrB/UvrC motif-containing protein [Candidatus Moranbacteria bacterium]
MSTISDKIKKLPQAPGVYFFKDAAGDVLYIGKATNLRSRVRSYFRGAILNLLRNPEGAGEMLERVQHDKKGIVSVPGRSEWIGSMVSQVADIEVRETDSVLEALILESNLIKKHQPKYNTDLKDDKSFAYFVITKEEFPRVLIVRKTDLAGMSKSKSQMTNKIQISNDEISKKFKYKGVISEKVFGPYTSKQQMETALKIIRRIFPFHALAQKSEKGCLDYQLGLCPGPHDGAISKEDYQKNIRAIRMILAGKKKSLVRLLEKEMALAAKNQEFEKAASLRNRIFALNHIRDVALMNREFEERIQDARYETQATRIEAYDISNISGQYAVGSMVVFGSGKPNKSQYRKFKIKTLRGSDDVGMMREVLARRFKNDWAMPDLVLLDGGQGHLNMAQKLLREDLGLALNIAAIAKGPTRKKLEVRMAEEIPPAIKDILSNQNLLKSVMDEAHRFAISFHRKVRQKGALGEGDGEKKSKKARTTA